MRLPVAEGSRSGGPPFVLATAGLCIAVGGFAAGEAFGRSVRAELFASGVRDGAARCSGDLLVLLVLWLSPSAASPCPSPSPLFGGLRCLPGTSALSSHLSSSVFLTARRRPPLGVAHLRKIDNIRTSTRPGHVRLRSCAPHTPLLSLFPFARFRPPPHPRALARAIIVTGSSCCRSLNV